MCQPLTDPWWGSIADRALSSWCTQQLSSNFLENFPACYHWASTWLDSSTEGKFFARSMRFDFRWSPGTKAFAVPEKANEIIYYLRSSKINSQFKLTKKSVGDRILISLLDKSSRSSDVSCWRLFDGTLFKALFGRPRIWRGVLSPLKAKRWTRLISPEDMKRPLSETPSKILASLRTVTFFNVQSRMETNVLLFLSPSAIKASPWTSPLHLSVSGTSQPHSRLRLSVIFGQVHEPSSAAFTWLTLRLFLSIIEFFLSALLALLLTYLGFFDRLLSLKLWSSSCWVKSKLWLILRLFTRCCCADGTSVEAGAPLTLDNFVISNEPFRGWLFCLLMICW